MDELSRNYLLKIGDSAQQLLSLNNDIIDLSMLESGKGVLNNLEFSFATTLEQVNSQFMAKCSDREIDYECTVVNQTDEYYIGDSIKIREVLMNILSISAQHTDRSGHINMTVEKISEYKDLDAIRFCVEDTGAGTDVTRFEAILESESFDYAGITSESVSVELGLSITKNIVAQMNGIITVESRFGIYHNPASP